MGGLREGLLGDGGSVGNGFKRTRVGQLPPPSPPPSALYHPRAHQPLFFPALVCLCLHSDPYSGTPRPRRSSSSARRTSAPLSAASSTRTGLFASRALAAQAPTAGTCGQRGLSLCFSGGLHGSANTHFFLECRYRARPCSHRNECCRYRLTRSPFPSHRFPPPLPSPATTTLIPQLRGGRSGGVDRGDGGGRRVRVGGGHGLGRPAVPLPRRPRGGRLLGGPVLPARAGRPLWAPGGGLRGPGGAGRGGYPLLPPSPQLFCLRTLWPHILALALVLALASKER